MFQVCFFLFFLKHVPEKLYSDHIVVLAPLTYVDRAICSLLRILSGWMFVKVYLLHFCIEYAQIGSTESVHWPLKYHCGCVKCDIELVLCFLSLCNSDFHILAPHWLWKCPDSCLVQVFGRQPGCMTNVSGPSDHSRWGYLGPVSLRLMTSQFKDIVTYTQN